MKIYGIKKAVLNMALEVAKDTYPKEFAAFLRAADGVIIELIFLPGTIGADRSTTIPLYMKPIDFSIVGSIHSHPSPNLFPSQADLSMFSRTGDVHIIVAYPYGMENWRAYDRSGNLLFLEIL